MLFKTSWSSDFSVCPQKKKIYFQYAHSAEPVEGLINKFIFSFVGKPPYWSWHTMSSCYWQQKNANKTINQSCTLCLLYTFCECIAHFHFNARFFTTPKSWFQTLHKMPSFGVSAILWAQGRDSYCALARLHLCCHRGEWIILFHRHLIINMQRRARPFPLCQVPFNIAWMYKDFFIST